MVYYDGRHKLCVRAFFIHGKLVYRTYDFRENLSRDEIDLVLGMSSWALIKRPYAVSKSRSKKFDAYVAEKINWNFEKYFYQVGSYTDGKVRPDGFLLCQRSLIDGETLGLFAPLPTTSLSQLSKYVNARKLTEYCSIFLDDDLSDVVSLFRMAAPPSVDNCFLELNPFLKSHAEFYLERYGLII